MDLCRRPQRPTQMNSGINVSQVTHSSEIAARYARHHTHTYAESREKKGAFTNETEKRNATVSTATMTKSPGPRSWDGSVRFWETVLGFDMLRCMADRQSGCRHYRRWLHRWLEGSP